MSKEKWERIPDFPYPTTSFTVSSLLLDCAFLEEERGCEEVEESGERIERFGY